MNTQEQIDALELFAMNDRRTVDRIDSAFRLATVAIQSAANELAKARADWHDDPEGDPEGYAEHHALASEQFSPEARAAVVVLMLERCERVRLENIANGGDA